MTENNPLLEKSLRLAVRIVKLNRYLTKEKHETIISKQIVRSGTSIGANANEAVYGISQADFIEKSQGESMLEDCLEIKRILVPSLKTVKENSRR